MSDVVKKSAQDELAEVQLAQEKLRLRKLELEAKRLEQDIADAELREANLKTDARTRGTTLAASNADEHRLFAGCNHLKGGNDRTYPQGTGDKGGYSIFRHTLPNNDLFIRCLRCGKEWLPPMKPSKNDPRFLAGGRFHDDIWQAATEQYTFDLAEYKKALMFNTDNSPSGAPQFRFNDPAAARAAFRGTNPPVSLKE